METPPFVAAALKEIMAAEAGLPAPLAARLVKKRDSPQSPGEAPVRTCYKILSRQEVDYHNYDKTNQCPSQILIYCIGSYNQRRRHHYSIAIIN